MPAAQELKRLVAGSRAALDGRRHELVEIERVAKELQKPDFLIGHFKSAAATSTAKA